GFSDLWNMTSRPRSAAPRSAAEALATRASEVSAAAARVRCRLNSRMKHPCRTRTGNSSREYGTVALLSLGAKTRTSVRGHADKKPRKFRLGQRNLLWADTRERHYAC